MHRVVHLHGYFAKFHPGPIRVTGDTIAEIVECITRQLAGFRPDPVKGRHRIKIAGCDTLEDTYRPLGDQIDIHIVPQMNGGKDNGALLQIGLGAVLLGVGFFMGATTFWGGMLMKAGALSLLGGLAQLLAPQPENDKDEQQKSRYLGAPKNTVKIGTRIPILYGEHQAYGHYLSFDINASEYKGTAKNTGGSSGGK